eukprot:gene1158-8747_t
MAMGMGGMDSSALFGGQRVKTSPGTFVDFVPLCGPKTKDEGAEQAKVTLGRGPMEKSQKISASQILEEKREEHAQEPVIIIDGYSLVGCGVKAGKGDKQNGFGVITGRRCTGGEFLVRYNARQEGGDPRWAIVDERY